jgi:hypothetical protein
MPIPDLPSWLPAAGPGADLLLWASLVPLLLLALWAGRRRLKARARVEAAVQELEKSPAGLESIFMRPPPLEQAVEIDGPLHVAPLVENDRSAVAASDRAPSLPAGHPRHAEASGRPPLPQSPSDQAAGIPVQDLLLTWYEARGYRFKPAPGRLRPIEFELRHASSAEHGYAFATVSQHLTPARAQQLLDAARQLGHSRLIIASECHVDEAVVAAIRKLGIRIFDPDSTRSEIAKADLRTAARIIAVARGRHEARAAGAGRKSGDPKELQTA